MIKRLAFLIGAGLASWPLAAMADDPGAPIPDLAPPAEAKPAPPPEPEPRRPEVVVIAPRETPAEAPPLAARTERLDRFRIALGTRVGFMKDEGFDTFADSDTLAQLSVEGTVVLCRQRLAFATGASYDVGGRGSSLRGVRATLTAHRLSVPLEGRYAFAPWLYGFARVAPGALAAVARAEDASSPQTLEGTTWLFSTDLSVGGSLRFASHFWLTPEIGYALTTRADVSVDPNRDEKEVLGRDAQSKLGSLALSGAYFRINAALTF